MDRKKDMSEAQLKLMRRAASEVRTALVKRENALRPIMERYDHVMEHGEEDEVGSAAFSLVVAVMLMDPVREAVNKFAEVFQLLEEIE